MTYVGFKKHTENVLEASLFKTEAEAQTSIDKFTKAGNPYYADYKLTAVLASEHELPCRPKHDIWLIKVIDDEKTRM